MSAHPTRCQARPAPAVQPRAATAAPQAYSGRHRAQLPGPPDGVTQTGKGAKEETLTPRRPPGGLSRTRCHRRASTAGPSPSAPGRRLSARAPPTGRSAAAARRRRARPGSGSPVTAGGRRHRRELALLQRDKERKETDRPREKLAPGPRLTFFSRLISAFSSCSFRRFFSCRISSNVFTFQESFSSPIGVRALRRHSRPVRTRRPGPGSRRLRHAAPRGQRRPRSDRRRGGIPDGPGRALARGYLSARAHGSPAGGYMRSSVRSSRRAPRPPRAPGWPSGGSGSRAGALRHGRDAGTLAPWAQPPRAGVRARRRLNPQLRAGRRGGKRRPDARGQGAGCARRSFRPSATHPCTAAAAAATAATGPGA